MRHLFKRIANRSTRRRYGLLERAYEADGLRAFRFQDCGECGTSVLTKMTGPAPKTCEEHN